MNPLKKSFRKARIYVRHLLSLVTGLLTFLYEKIKKSARNLLALLAATAVAFFKLLKIILSKARIYKWTSIIIGVIFISLTVAAILYIRNSQNTRIYYVAYVGRYERKDFDLLHELALQKYLDELNADLVNVELKLKKFSNEEGDVTKSQQAYEQIAADDTIIAVIDNIWGSELQTAADIIREKDIPVIAVNANKQDIDFANNIVFIGHDDNVPKSVTDFSNKILETKHVIFITEENFTSKNVFDTEFKKLGVEISRFGVSSSKIDQNEENNLFRELDSELVKWQQRQEKPTIILNTHAKWGLKIINYLDGKSLGSTILGGPYISDSDLGQFGENNNGNRLIMLTNPSDAVTNKIYNDLKDISLDNPKAAEILNAQLFTKRCLDSVSIIRRVFTDESGQNLKSEISRADFINFFRNKLVANNFIGKYDLYSFNENLLLIDDKTFEERAQGEKSSFPKQLNSRREIIPNVYFGIEVVNISNIDITNRYFHADFFYWLKYDKNYKVEEYIHFRNEKQQDSGQEIALSEENGSTVYKLYKKSADFSIDVDFKKFPFDTQELKIELALIVPSDQVLISFDYEGFKDSQKKIEEFNVNDWKVKDFYVTVDNFITTSSRGGQSLISKKPRKFKTLTVRMPIKRRIESPLVTVIMPLVMIGFSAIAILFIKNNLYTDVISAIFLSIVTYSIGFAQLTPRTNTLNIADKLFYFTFFIVLLIFLKVVFFNSNLINKNLGEWADNRATLIGSIAFVLYGVMVTIILFWG